MVRHYACWLFDSITRCCCERFVVDFKFEFRFRRVFGANGFRMSVGVSDSVIDGCINISKRA